MKKIMFNDKYGLTKAVLEGRKTQTRRIVPKSALADWEIHDKYHNLPDSDGSRMDFEYFIARYAKFKIGEEVAVAQRYRDVCHEVFLFSTKVRGKEYRKGWANKMFVKADLMPHRIKINNIRIERLQDISEEDCIKEGVYYHTEPPKHHEYDRYSPWNPSVKPYKFESKKYFCSAKYAFKHLIEKVSGKGTWQSNPYVFVYDFELIKQ